MYALCFTVSKCPLYVTRGGKAGGLICMSYMYALCFTVSNCPLYIIRRSEAGGLICMSYMYALCFTVSNCPLYVIRGSEAGGRICTPDMYALYVYLICMPCASLSPSIRCMLQEEVRRGGRVHQPCHAWGYALYVCLICTPYMYASYVCLICMPCASQSPSARCMIFIYTRYYTYWCLYIQGITYKVWYMSYNIYIHRLQVPAV